jgi:4-amino-4-deoxy-L-arabinose transferase-like glycosyltransferase
VDTRAPARASGQPFPTMEVPWGYAYFLAGLYRLFGDRPWNPLLVQVGLNATTPLLLYALARRWTDAVTASLAAVLLGAFSFNTVYASTQSSDAICTVLFLTSILVFMKAVEEDKRAWFVLLGCAGATLTPWVVRNYRLTNMRYSVTVQPLMFVFVAASILALARPLLRGTY